MLSRKPGIALQQLFAVAFKSITRNSGSDARTRECHCVPIAAVFPCACCPKPRRAQKASDARIGEFIAIFRVNGLARHKAEIEVYVLDRYILRSRALEVHLDPGFDGIPDRAMTKMRCVEVRPEFSIEAMQDVEVERRRNSIIVIIGR